MITKPKKRDRVVRVHPSKERISDKTTDLSAARFVERLKSYVSSVELKKIRRYFKTSPGDYGAGDTFIGVRMGQIFALAKEFINMSPKEIEKLLESPVHEVRVGAVSIMDWQARNKKTPESRRKELFNLYVKRHDRINSWDLVDRSAPYVVGGYLSDKPRDILYKLARSKDTWERRTAIVSTYYFIRQGDVDDTFKIAEMLVDDNQDLINKAVGGWVCEAGKRDRRRLLSFLDRHAATMPRVALRYAIEHLDKKQRDHYLSMKKVGRCQPILSGWFTGRAIPLSEKRTRLSVGLVSGK
jgi:3-methyladenine DNA glycosylase AlkD